MSIFFSDVNVILDPTDLNFMDTIYHFNIDSNPLYGSSK